MLSKSDTSIATILNDFSNSNVDFGFLVPTKTALDKSIIDANSPFRDFLSRNHIHNYDEQLQGEKILVKGLIITKDEEIETQVSLYRPNTKQGDPRVWIYKLKEYCNPNNLIGMVYDSEILYIFNFSQKGIIDFILSEKNPYSYIFVKDPIITNTSANDLYNKLKIISKKGYIKTVIGGDTGVGVTLENELGINQNSLAAPDYKGIEIKASRKKTKGTRNRVTLFSKVPNWKKSPKSRAIQLLNSRGYIDNNGRLSLYHTLNAKSVNSIGLMLQIDYSEDIIKQVFINNEDNHIEHDVSWDIKDLKDSLAKKHPNTFWVKAEFKKIDGVEYFHYTEIMYSRGAQINNFESLIEDGIITIDYALHQKGSGNGVRDHGYLFKIKPENIKALFPDPLYYSLQD